MEVLGVREKQMDKLSLSVPLPPHSAFLYPHFLLSKS